MEWLKSLIFGLVSGIAEFLPVSGWAHGLLLAKMFGKESMLEINTLSCHLGGLVAVIFLTKQGWQRLFREQRIYRTPQRKRPRPADGKTILQFRLLKKAALILGIAMILTGRMGPLSRRMGWVAFLVFLNGCINLVSDRLPKGNKDGRSVAAVDGVLVGFGGTLGILPGMSALGGTLCVFLMRGFDPVFAVENSLLLTVPALAGCVLGDIIRMVSAGFGGFSLSTALSCLFAAGGTFAGAFFGILEIRRAAEKKEFSRFAYYCWGLALFMLIMYLTV